MILPDDHRPYTDKYFQRSNMILKKENLNPIVGMKVFTRGEGKVAGLEDMIKVIEQYSDLKEKKGEVWVTKKEDYTTKEPLAIIKGPIQSYIELETMDMGVLSAEITKKAGIKEPNPVEIKEKLKRLKAIYQEVPIFYFGARHYSWEYDQMIAKAALEGGAVQTSTDMGSSNIGKEGVGTMPHALILTLAYKYGKENATAKAAELFDKYMDPSIPRVTLVDTFNRELTDSLMVAKYFGERRNGIRIDTCGENVGEGGEKNYFRDSTFQKGTGVTIELAINLRNNLIRNGFGNSTYTLLSSSFGNEDKAKAFMKAHFDFKEKTGYNLFEGVGIGEVSDAIFCTADIFEINGKPFSKTGREVSGIDYSTLMRVI